MSTDAGDASATISDSTTGAAAVAETLGYSELFQMRESDMVAKYI